MEAFIFKPMALEPITQLVKNRLPFLGTAHEAKIVAFTSEAFYFFQTYLKKPDEEVETEATYKPLERMLIADYVAYNLLVNKAIETTGGTDGEAPTTKMVKRTKADVVETEFMTVKASDGTLIQIDAEKLIAQLQRDLCNKAYTLGVYLPMCGVPKSPGINVPFIVPQ